MKGAHTPGPWEVKRVERFHVGIPGQIGADPADFLTEANARLIAAAPDLLQALVQLLDAIDNPRMCRAEFEAGRAAIHLATGS